MLSISLCLCLPVCLSLCVCLSLSHTQPHPQHTLATPQHCGPVAFKSPPYNLPCILVPVDIGLRNNSDLPPLRVGPTAPWSLQTSPG